MRRPIAVAVVALSVAIACSGPASILEEPFRVPDDQGVATDMTLERIELDGERAYRISDRVESFRTRTLEVTQLLFWEGKYVQVGVDGDGEVAWIAGIGVVSDADPPRTLYSGIFSRMEGDRLAIFEDGTALTLAAGVQPPDAGVEVVATIDPTAYEVIDLVAP